MNTAIVTASTVVRWKAFIFPLGKRGYHCGKESATSLLPRQDKSAPYSSISQGPALLFLVGLGCVRLACLKFVNRRSFSRLPCAVTERSLPTNSYPLTAGS